VALGCHLEILSVPGFRRGCDMLPNAQHGAQAIGRKPIRIGAESFQLSQRRPGKNLHLWPPLERREPRVPIEPGLS